MDLKTKDTFFSVKNTLNAGGNILDLGKPVVMGILNLTPDSFYDGGVYFTEKEALKRAEQILSEGGTIIDMGAYSSRPGAVDISPEEELERLIPALKAIVKEFPEAVISADTFRAAVAEQAVSEGAAIINDISGGGLDNKMFETVARLKVPYILMHMRGNPETMTKLTDYEDVLKEVLNYFSEKVYALRLLGVKDIIIDPGFGFSKTKEQSFSLVKELNYFKLLNLPILAGVSRKSMIYKTLNTSADEALNGTTVLNTVSLLKAANILRVHDVKEAVEAVKLINLITD